MRDTETHLLEEAYAGMYSESPQVPGIYKVVSKYVKSGEVIDTETNDYPITSIEKLGDNKFQLTAKGDDTILKAIVGANQVGEDGFVLDDAVFTWNDDLQAWDGLNDSLVDSELKEEDAFEEKELAVAPEEQEAEVIEAEAEGY